MTCAKICAWKRGLAVGFAALAFVVLHPGLTTASAGERAISFYNIHTKDNLTVVFKRDGKYIPEALEKLNWFLRDWRRDVKTKMDPELFDILASMHEELQSERPIHVISGYRSPKTNEMLRRTRGGQARRSRHLVGQAIDVHFPDVPVRQLRYAALVRQQGGVGYYPTSSLPFVHVDTGRVRHWPRMTRAELALLFPNGRTRHVPTDGKRIRRRDARIARKKKPQLAMKVAAYHNLRIGGGDRVPRWSTTTQLARKAKTLKPAAPKLVAAKMPTPQVPPAVPAPRLTAAPTLLAAQEPQTEPKSSSPAGAMLRRLAKLNNAQGQRRDKARLTQLAALASSDGFLGQTPLIRTNRDTDRQSNPDGQGVKTTQPSKDVQRPSIDDMLSGANAPSGWDRAEFDQEHPEELYYTPFPISPYLTATSSMDDDALVVMRHPDPEQTLAFLAEAGAQPMVRLISGASFGRMTSAQTFSGSAVARPPELLAAPVPSSLPSGRKPTTFAMR